MTLELTQAREACLRVEDDGPGIAARALLHLFESGFSAGKPGGSGHGLAIVSGLVCRAGGSVRAWNLPADDEAGGDGGAVFEVLFPGAAHAATGDVGKPRVSS